MAKPIGCSLWFSAVPVTANSISKLHWAGFTNKAVFTTTGDPWVKVPVLSKTTVFTWKCEKMVKLMKFKARTALVLLFNSKLNGNLWLLKLRANGRNNSQHCWATLLRVLASVLEVESFKTSTTTSTRFLQFSGLHCHAIKNTDANSSRQKV